MGQRSNPQRTGDDEPGGGTGYALVIRRRDGMLVSPTDADPDDRVSPQTDQQYWRGIPKATQDVYTYQWNRFVNWCVDEANGVRSYLPARPGTVREYIRAHWDMTRKLEDGTRVYPGRNGQRYSFETVNLACKVISIVHQGFGYQTPTKHPDVKVQRRGYRDDWLAAGYVQDVASSLTPDEVLRLVATCDLDTVAGVRDALLMRLAYDVGRRNAEFMALNWSGLRWVDDRRARVTFPRGKTVKDGKAQVVGVEADDVWAPETDPLLLWRTWRELCAGFDLPVAGGAPVFREVRLGRRRKVGISGVIVDSRMTRGAFQDMVAMRAELAGVDQDPVTHDHRKIAPHSFRHAFAGNGDDEGVPIHQLADRGGWARTSPQILGYMHTAEKWGDQNPGVRMRLAAARRRDEAAASAAAADDAQGDVG